MTNKVTQTILVEENIANVYELWANFEHFPRFMKYIKSVNKVGDVSEWKVEGPLGRSFTWEAEITSKEPNKRIAWNSKDREGDITTSGQVTFKPISDQETEVTVVMQVTPSNKADEALAWLLNQPYKQLEEDLRNFKEYAEGMDSRIVE